ncbi:hypothetical protein [Chlamydiifrater phoenicopteri]|uniref:hypothetical protein n=1 Tax=Chlamydiifrater phoenicopteri TaxID=2681469 RepID=UPI001BCE012F|nr:hypothetical protein [Chlamydiifrater phoenicopteri]
MSVHSFFSRQKGVGFTQPTTLSPDIRETPMPSNKKTSWGSLRTKIFFAMCVLGFSGFLSGVVCSMVLVNPAYLVLSLAGSITLVTACIILRLSSFFQQEAFDIIRLPGSLFSFLRSKTHFFGPFNRESFCKELRNRFVAEIKTKNLGKWKPVKKPSSVTFFMGKRAELEEQFLGAPTIEICGASLISTAEEIRKAIFRKERKAPEWFLSQVDSLDQVNTVRVVSEFSGQTGLGEVGEDLASFTSSGIVVGKFLIGETSSNEELQVIFPSLSKMFLDMLKEGVSQGKRFSWETKELILKVTIPELCKEGEFSSKQWLIMLSVLHAVEALNNEFCASEGRNVRHGLKEVVVVLPLETPLTSEVELSSS